MSLNHTNIISVNSRVARSVNRAMILNLIRQRQPISRVQIARLTGLNKSTVSSIVSELITEDLIFEQVTEDQNIGRNPINLSLKVGKFFVGAINVDATNTRFAITDIDGTIKCTSSIKTDPSNPEKLFTYCMNELDSLRIKNKIKVLEGIGVSIAGIVDSQKLLVKYAPNLGWEDEDLGALFRKNWPQLKNLSIGNDAKASALAELWFGIQDVPLSNFVFISVGAGIGSGIVVDNKLLDGEFHASGEFGHMSIFEGREQCKCGNVGCWEAYASDKATIKHYYDKKEIVKDDNVDILFQDIVEQAHNGDTKAIEVLKNKGNYLGSGIVNIIKALDPHAIVLGGKVTSAWDIVYPEIMEVVKTKSFFSKEKSIKILPTSLKVRPRLLGAATLAIKMIFDDYKIVA